MQKIMGNTCKYDDYYMVDDMLYKSEVDLIYTVYHIPRDPTVYEQLSWWPQPHICGAKVGWMYWSEAWFHSRLDKIEKWTAMLYNASEWRKGIKYTQAKTKFVRLRSRLLLKNLLTLPSTSFHCFSSIG